MYRALAILIFLAWHPVANACDPLPGMPGEDVTVTMMHDGIERSYVLHLPTNYDCQTSMPLLVGIHGYNNSGIRFENEQMRIFDHINENNYIGVFPNGVTTTADWGEVSAWGGEMYYRGDIGPDGMTCEPPVYEYPKFEDCPDSVLQAQCYFGNSCVDDQGFIRAIIEHLIARYSVDPARIYMTGHSMGSMTINGIVADLHDLLAAVAPVQGMPMNGYAEAGKSRLAYLQVWARQDTVMPGGGEPASDMLLYDSHVETAAVWAEAQGCSADGTTPYPSSADGKSAWACAEHADCRDGSEVVTCAFDGDHTWPSDGDDNYGFDMMWEFFQRHSKTGPIKSAKDERPNILLIVADDLGYADLGVFGSEISTPNIDALADEGMLFTQFHTAPSCGPTRAMLLSGNNNHVAGMARQNTTGISGEPYPGYENYLSERIIPFPELLQESGYHTYMAGKWHLGTALEHSPVSKGFERSFALLAGAGDHFSSLGFGQGDSVYRDDSTLVEWPKGRYSTDFYTDKLLEYLESNRGDGKPFFMFASYTSPHWPLQAPDEYLDRYAGQYDRGYDHLREQRMDSLKAAGIISESSGLPPRNDSITLWEDLNEEQQRSESRKMELYSSMVDNLDDHVGRLIEYLKEHDLYENTLIVFMSDNGAAHNDFYNDERFSTYLQANYDNAYEGMGKPGSFVSYGAPWAEAGSAPFQRHKSHAREGGIVAPMIISGTGVSGAGEKSSTYLTVMDLAPTFLELAGAEYPVEGEVQAMRGESFKGFLEGATEAVHGDDYITVFSHGGRASIRKGNWKMSTLEKPFDESKFELFDILADPGETTDMAGSEPEIYQELLELWRSERKELGIVLPQDL